MRLMVINGPNIDLLGRREPDIYGARTYAELTEFIARSCAENGFSCEICQSNHEGDIVDRIQEAACGFDGIVINPAAYTHTSVAILDALLAVGLPAVEVHLSDVARREDFRRVSYAGRACLASFSGKGFESYAEAVRFMKGRLDEKK